MKLKHISIVTKYFKEAILISIVSCFILIPAFNFSVLAQTSKQDVPMIGAQIFIEPGQPPQEIDTLFKRLKEGGMKITRIRMFETYMHKPDGTWDFSLFDHAFECAEKYNIKVYATLFPATPFSDVGGFKFPRDEEHFKSISEYIKNVVTHFKQFSSLYGWIPINEPCIYDIPEGQFTQNKFKDWSVKQPLKDYDSNGYEHFNFADNQFLLYYNVWYLKWLINEIRKYDEVSPIQVNPHDLFENVAYYNFPKWRKFLTSLGGSAHASWHFGYFKRNQYSVAMSATSEIIRSGAGQLPWLMTEVQGGNNIFSGFNPMCPTKEEISQWLWIIIGSGSKGAIFWCLNPRASGFEAGEWAMLNFQDKPSDRMKAASKVAGIINNNASLFANAKVLESGINVLYSREALWVEKKLAPSKISKYEGRNTGAVMKSALAYFEALCEMGIQSNLKEIGEFDFTKKDFTGSTIILSNQISIPSRYWQNLTDFVKKGGKLIVDGLTAYFDENAVCIMKTGFPLEKLFGGNIKEFKLIGDQFQINLDDPKITLPSHFQIGFIKATSAKIIGSYNNEAIAVRNIFGKGEVIWIPTLLGLGARIENDYGPLSVLLSKEIGQSLNNIPFRFKRQQSGMLMKTLQSGTNFITIIINESLDKRTVPLEIKKGMVNPTVLFANKNGSISGNTIKISPEETIVIKWQFINSK
jgi:beta-galactosidase